MKSLIISNHHKPKPGINNTQIIGLTPLNEFLITNLSPKSQLKNVSTKAETSFEYAVKRMTTQKINK